MKNVILLNVNETSKILGVKEDAVTKLIIDGKLKAVRYGKKTSKYRILSSDVEGYLLKEYKNTNRSSWDKRFAGVDK